MSSGQGGLATLPRPGVALGLSLGLCLGFGLGLGVGLSEAPAVLRLGTTMLAVFLAAAVSSVVGFAFSALCSPLLRPLTEDPVQAVVIMAVASLSIQGLTIWRLRRDLECRGVFPFLLGGLATLPLGVHLLLTLAPGAHAWILGSFLMGYGGLMLVAPKPGPVPTVWRFPGSVLAGAMGGITGGLAAFPGALPVIWCGLLGWPKTRQRVVFQLYILVMQIVTLALIAVMASAGGLAGGPLGALQGLALAHVPPALLGALLGLRLYRQLSERSFGRAVNLLLIVAGAGLAW